MTEPLNYATPVVEKTPLIAWLAIAFAVLAVLVDVVGERLVVSIAVVTVNGNTTTVVQQSAPIWVHLVQALAVGCPLIGLGLGIVAVRRVRTKKSAAIVGIVLNALMLGAVLLIA